MLWFRKIGWRGSSKHPASAWQSVPLTHREESETQVCRDDELPASTRLVLGNTTSLMEPTVDVQVWATQGCSLETEFGKFHHTR